MKLYLSDAIEFVRSRIDELPYSNDDMISPADDDRNFDNTVEKILPEAAEFAYRAASADFLAPDGSGEVSVTADGAAGSGDVLGNVTGSVSRGVASLYFDTGDSGLLRVISIADAASRIHVTRFFPYDTPEARMQRNPYTRGTPDDPAVVIIPSQSGFTLEFYTVNPFTEEVKFDVRFITVPAYKGDMTGKYIFCPDRMNYAVLNRLTAMVLDAYNDPRSQQFYQKANSYLQ